MILTKSMLVKTDHFMVKEKHKSVSNADLFPLFNF